MKKNMLGALTLVAALALGGVVPAFAATTAQTSGETPVTIETTISKVDVTVPIALPIIAEANGNNDCLAPSGETYRFINNSGVIPLRVVAAQVLPGNQNAGYADWTLAAYSADGTTLPTQDAAATYGTIAMKLTPGAVDAGAMDLFAYQGDGPREFTSMSADGQAAWKIAKDDGELPIDVAAMNSPLKTTREGATEAFRICWTVASDF